MGTPLNVLLVEDSEDDAELLALELARNGFSPSICRVETGPDMAAALATGGWDVVLSDYHLPRFSAEAALATLRASGQDLPFIILSGLVQAEDAVSLLKRGAHDFLNKDSLARLAPAIERELRDAAERTQRRRAEERVRILSAVVEQSPVAVVVTDCDGIIEYVNPKFEEATGYLAAEAAGRPLDFTQAEPAGQDAWHDLWPTLASGRPWHGEVCNRHRDGHLFWEGAIVAPLKDDTGVVTHFVAVKEDVTARRAYEEQLLRQANYDDLTGLPNRVLMQDRLDRAIAMARRQGGLAALLYIDLDRFKNVNDSLGHMVGDRLLKEAAARLLGLVRETDTVARMGGDEFVIILPDLPDSTWAQRVAERVVERFAEPFVIDGHDLFVTATIGITLFPTDGADQQALLRKADLAMYKAKDTGRNTYRFFTPEIDRRMRERLALESRLRGAVARNELELHYQPIVALDGGATVALEALVRWRQPDGRLCMPGDFIGLAEEVRLIQDIGDWVMATACTDLGGHPCPTPLRVAVNVSALQLQAPGFGPRIRHLLHEHALAPDRLELEITESVLLDDAPETATNIRMLCDLGVRLAIDDFGTGFSSLGYLQRYPFDTLKIDRSFVADCVAGGNAARLVETIIAMGHGLGLEIIAEGVETPDQLAFLRGHGCDLAQGYLFGHPRPAGLSFAAG